MNKVSNLFSVKVFVVISKAVTRDEQIDPLNQIYHLSCWDDGESSSSKPPEDNLSIKRHKGNNFSLIDLETSRSESCRDRSFDDKKRLDPKNPNPFRRKREDFRGFCWKPP